MDAIYIRRSSDTPEIKFDPNALTFDITGRSLPENVYEFYTPVINWLNDFSPSFNKQITWTFRLTYINSASAKIVIGICEKLNQLHQQGAKFKIEWYFNREEEDIQELGNDIKEVVSFPVEIEEAAIR